MLIQHTHTTHTQTYRTKAEKRARPPYSQTLCMRGAAAGKIMPAKEEMKTAPRPMERGPPVVAPESNRVV